MAMSSAVVGVAAMFAWCLVTATIIAIDGSYRELVLVQQILRREILLGGRISKYVGSVHFTAIQQRQTVYSNSLGPEEACYLLKGVLATSVVGLGHPLNRN
jgi:hypothetical protein